MITKKKSEQAAKGMVQSLPEPGIIPVNKTT